VIKIKDREASKKLAAEVLLHEAGPVVPNWLDRLGTEPPEGRVSRLPGSEDLSGEFNAQLIIELLSR
jgi:small subunit ribosomal protein S4